MIGNKKDAYALLDRNHYVYEVFDHPAVFTIEEMQALPMPHQDQVAKNLFLQDDKKKNFYLVTVPGHKTVDFRSLSERIPSRKLSFANEEKLRDMLKLEKGSVTPLGVLNNDCKNVIVVFDSSLRGQKIGIHPMENTATIFISFEDILKLIQEHGNPVVMVNFEP